MIRTVAIAKEAYNPIEEKDLYEQQLLELKKISLQLSLITDENIKEYDIDKRG